MSFSESVEADRRLIILQLLVANNGGASESVIERHLLDMHERTNLDRRTVRRFIKELETADCVVVTMVRDITMVAEITARGVAVAEGRITVDGVSKPTIGV